MTSLVDITRSKRLVVLVGEGGVGKTSCAAALALSAACRGRRVAVLTIDPAPRLGHALGLKTLDDKPRAVELPPTAAHGGALDAFRLDAKRTFDRMIERLAPTPQAARAVIGNPIYRALAGTVGEAESYMALQRFYELREENHYDLVVVDTPPVVHAADLLSAPSRLRALIETDAARVLANPAVVVAKAGSALARASAAIVLPLLERVTGMALRTQLTDFVSNFESVLLGLTRRAGQVDDWLRSAETSFVVVTRASERSAATTSSLVRSLAERKIDVDAVVVNRLSPSRAREPQRRAALLAGAPPGTEAALEEIERAMESQRASERGALAQLRHEVAPLLDGAGLMLELGSLEHDVGGLADLIALGEGGA